MGKRPPSWLRYIDAAAGLAALAYGMGGKGGKGAPKAPIRMPLPLTPKTFTPTYTPTKPYVPTGTGTKRRRTSIMNPYIRPRRFGPSTGRSAGKFRRGKRKYAKKNWKKQKYGVSLNKESGKLYTAQECIFIGHATCPIQTMRENMWRALVKRLYLEGGGYDLTDMNKALPAATRFDVFWKNDGISGAQSVESFVTVGVETLEIVAQWCASNDRVFNNGEYANTRIYTWFRVWSDIDPVANSLQQARISLANVYINYTISCSYKIQNRSINAVDWSPQDGDNVDNVPLYGKSYEGNGNGVIVKNYNTPLAPTLMADMNFGMIEGGATVNNLNEPPYASDFMFAKRSGKVRIEPGTIKTSVLRYKKTASFLNLQREFNVSNDIAYVANIPVTAKRMTRFGKFRMFGLEKMIDAQSGLPMTIATEHNIRMDTWTTLKEKNHTVQLTEKDFLPGGAF